MHSGSSSIAVQRSSSEDAVLGYARDVIMAEAAALSQLALMIDANFANAVGRIVAASGRLIVTGMGKSGHVGRKIAATFAATGTPALFVHPAEAAHGDLGMLVRGDLLLVLSNSGRTAELHAIVAHARRLQIDVVAIASRADSLLMRQADVPLLLPVVREACPANIAPTTSTALMMALGDALAIAAMRVRGYTPNSLQALHPGGQIGLRFTAVSSLMHGDTELPLVGPTDRMHDVILAMTSKSFGVAGVVDGEGQLIGIITDGDLRRHADGLMDSVAGDVMTRDPVTIEPNGTAEVAVELMNEHRITSLFVVRSGPLAQPIGIVHVHDLMRLGLI